MDNNSSLNRLVYVALSDEDIHLLESAISLDHPTSGVVKRIIYQANDSPIFCSSFNKPIKHLNPKLPECQPFPYVCSTCPMALFEE